MEGGARACLIAIAIALIALQSCGAGSDGRGSAEVAKAGGRIGAEADRDLRRPRLHRPAPRIPELLFVVEQPGRVEVLRKGRKLRHPFLDISSRVAFGGERGLLSIAFPPDYRQSRRFYVYYTDKRGNIRVDEFKRRTPTRAAAGSRRTVIEIPHPGYANHNGGQLQFLGNLLYFGTGDGGSGGDPPNNAQNKERPARASSCGSTRGPPAAGHTRSPPPTRSSGTTRGATRSTATGCATRSASPSTRPSPGSRGSRSATSARTGSRSSTTPPSPRRPAPTSAGTRSRASPPTATKTAARPTRAAPSSRSSPTPTAATAAARSSAATSSPTPASSLCGALRLRRPLRGPAASLVPHLQPGQRRPQARPRGRLAELVRRRRRRRTSMSPRWKDRSYRLVRTG